MKYILTLSLFLVNFPSFGQLTFTLTSDTICHPPGVDVSGACTIEIENSTDSSIQLSIVRLTNDVAPHWLNAICTSVFCYPASVDSVSLEIASGTTEEIKLFFQFFAYNADTAHALFLFRNEQDTLNRLSQNFYGVDSTQPLSILPLKQKKSIIIAPNPFRSSTIIQFPEHLDNERLQIITSKGIIVKSVLVTGSSYEMHSDGLPKGWYFLRLESGKHPAQRLLIQ